MSMTAMILMYSLCCICAPFSYYYRLFRMNLGKLQNIFFIIFCYFTYCVINYLPYYASDLPKTEATVIFLIAASLDVCLAIFTIAFLTDNEPVFTGLFSMVICTRLTTGLGYSITEKIIPASAQILMEYTYEDGSMPLSDMCIYLTVIVCTTIILWYPARFLKKQMDKLDSSLRRMGITRVLDIISIIASLLVIALTTLNYALDKHTGKMSTSRFMPNFLISVFFILLVFLIYLSAKKLHYNMELKQLQSKCDLTEKKYETLLAENDDLRKIRHELNKHLTAAKGLASFQPDSEIMQYVQEFTDAGKYLSQLSQCGNIYIDTQIEQYYKIFKKQNVVFETVLEPLLDKPEIADRLSLILEEFLNFASKDIRDKVWCRFSLRTRKNHILVCMEVGFGSKREYKRRKFIDMLGNEMIVRQRIKQTRILTREMNGRTFYSLNPEKLKLAAMITKTSQQVME